MKLGGKQMMLGVARDITERKMAEEVLKRSEERFRTILEDMENGYFELDLRGSYIFINDAMCKILGRSRDEIMARNFAGFLDPLDSQIADNISKITNDVLTGGSIVFGLVSTVIKGDGSKRNIGFSASPIRSTAGDIIGARGICRDITDRMKMEQQLLVTSKLASIGELAAGVAHEINNPLTAIMGYAQLLVTDENMPATAREDLDKIFRQSQRAARIVQNLLTFARGHALESRPVSINELILKTLDMRNYEHNVSNIEVRTELADSLPEIWVDETQIQQVLLNIIVNAEQALSARGRGTILVTTGQMQDRIRIVIADDGPGIPADVLDRLFDPFYTTKEVGKGTGLGLSVCHGIVTRHGGRIYAESEEGRGAAVTIELPVTRKPAPAAGHETVSPVSGVDRIPVIKKVLVVDDEVVIRDILMRILTEKGYKVETASTGLEGLNKIEAGEYDAYLLDIKMPGIDGKDMYELIGKKSTDLAERVIFITGDTVTRSTQDFLESTGRLYMSKPLDFNRLLNHLSEL
jgi:two-component system NtrC family sensor kinase